MTPYYQDSAVTIYHGDCLEVMAWIDTVDHVITDPPYEAEAHTKQRELKRGNVMVREPLTFPPITEDVRRRAAGEIGRVVRRWVVCFCQVEAAMKWRHEFEQYGCLNFRRIGVWIKPDGIPQYSGDRPGTGHETIVFMHRHGRSTWNGGGRHGVFSFNKGDGSGLQNEHQTQKPLPLMRELVSLFTDPGETILDPFMGSGTTLRAAKDLGRRAIGIEINEKYCEVAARRMQQEVLPLAKQPEPTQPELLGGVKP